MLDDEEAYVSADYVTIAKKLDRAVTQTELKYGKGVSDVRVDLVNFAKQFLDISLPLDQFAGSLQRKLQELKIGVLRIEDVNEETGKIILTVSEDADCSGLPVLGETVCNYDEGFISGILSLYSGKTYEAIEVDCWATGDRVCRFHAEIKD